MKRILLTLLCLASTAYGISARRNDYGPNSYPFYFEYKDATEKKTNTAYKLLDLYKTDRAAYDKQYTALLREHLGSGPGMLPLKFLINFGHFRLTHFIRMKRLGWKFKNVKVKDSPLLPVTAQTMPHLAQAVSDVAKKFGFTKPVTAFITDQPFYLASTAGPLRDYGVLLLSPGDLVDPDDEAVYNTLAHEMGHIDHRHIIAGFGSCVVLYLGLVIALTKLRNKVLPKDKSILNRILEVLVPLSSAGITYAAFPLLSRFAERQADAAAARVTDPRYGVKTFALWARREKPDMRHPFWRYFDSHPSHEERAQFFESQIPIWDAQQKEQELATAA